MGSLGFSGLKRPKQFFPASKLFSAWQYSERTVVAAVCYRIRPDDQVEFLLVRTKAGRWTFPKGGVEGDPSFAAAAAREAYEEAGVLGRVHHSCFARYLHRKNGRGAHLVHAHLFEVMHVGRTEEVHRFPTWFSAEKAKRRLRRDRPAALGEQLERVVDAAVWHLINSERKLRSH